jgi:hypothetical protein
MCCFLLDCIIKPPAINPIIAIKTDMMSSSKLVGAIVPLSPSANSSMGVRIEEKVEFNTLPTAEKAVPIVDNRKAIMPLNPPVENRGGFWFVLLSLSFNFPDEILGFGIDNSL